MVTESRTQTHRNWNPSLTGYGLAFEPASRHAIGRGTLDNRTPKEYGGCMFTVIETPLFQRQWPLYWSEEERGVFAAYIATHPGSGDVIPESGGLRKVRWSQAGSGKSGGVRVIYYTLTAEGKVVLLTLYAKAKTDNLTGSKLREIRRALEN
jgi:hypothetical protein